MTKWRIELRDIHSARDVGTIIVNADRLGKAKQHAVRVYRRRLSGSGEVHLEAKGRCTYWIAVAEDKVGEARITRLESSAAEAPYARRAAKYEPLLRRGTIGCSWRKPRRGVGPVSPLYLEA